MQPRYPRRWLLMLLSTGMALLHCSTAGHAQTDRKKAAQENQARMETAVSCARTVAFLASPGEGPLLALCARKWDEKLEPWREWIAALPELRTQFTHMVVYQDGVVIRQTFTNLTPEAVRIDLPRNEWWMRGFRFRASNDEIWEITPPDVHVCQFNPSKESETPLVEADRSLEVEFVVHAFDNEPNFHRLRKSGAAQVDSKPTELTYEYRFLHGVMRESRELHTLTVKELGKGSVKVEWKDEKLPRDLRTRVIAPPAKSPGSN